MKLDTDVGTGIIRQVPNASSNAGLHPTSKAVAVIILIIVLYATAATSLQYDLSQTEPTNHFRFVWLLTDRRTDGQAKKQVPLKKHLIASRD